MSAQLIDLPSGDVAQRGRWVRVTPSEARSGADSASRLSRANLVDGALWVAAPQIRQVAPPAPVTLSTPCLTAAHPGQTMRRIAAGMSGGEAIGAHAVQRAVPLVNRGSERPPERVPVSSPPEVPVCRPRAGGSVLRLTRRGLAVVVGFFTALMATSAIVLVTGFLGVSNDPPESPPVVKALAG